VTNAPVTVVRMTLDEFIRLYDQEGPFEIIDGDKVPVLPTVARHNVTTRTLFRALDRFAEANQVGEVFSEGPFVLLDKPNWVKGSRVPDIMFFAAERLAEYQAQDPDWGDKPFVLVPDLVVEVVSPGDSYSDVDEKVDGYLRDGVKMVWVVDPQRRKIKVRLAGSMQETTLVEDDTLGGGNILPGFQMQVRDIFSPQSISGVPK
jgi:Uma2 family endonuclease